MKYSAIDIIQMRKAIHYYGFGSGIYVARDRMLEIEAMLVTYMSQEISPQELRDTLLAERNKSDAR